MSRDGNVIKRVALFPKVAKAQMRYGKIKLVSLTRDTENTPVEASILNDIAITRKRNIYTLLSSVLYIRRPNLYVTSLSLTLLLFGGENSEDIRVSIERILRTSFLPVLKDRRKKRKKRVHTRESTKRKKTSP